MVRLPSVRRPRTFFDVFAITVATIAVVAAVLAVWHGTIVRIEMGAFSVLVFVWVVWAVTRILERSVERSKTDRTKNGR